MTRSLLFAATVLASLHSTAQYLPPDPTGLEGIIVETYYVADANDAADTDGGVGLDPGEVTYRVFVDLKPGYRLITVGGFVDHPLVFATTTTFFNNDDRGEAWGRSIPSNHLNKNTVAIDTWLTIGAASNLHWGVTKDDDSDGSVVGGANNDGGSNGVPGGLLVNDTPAMDGALTATDGLINIGVPPTISSVGTAPDFLDSGGGNSYSNDNFAYAVLGTIAGPTPANRILIGQFTTDGVFTFCLNLWVKIPDSLVCNDPNCHTILEYYGVLLPSDTAGTAFSTDNKFAHPTLCFDSSQIADCLGIPGGPAQPGSPCDDGNPDTSNDVYDADCACAGEDCEGLLGGPALPGTACDDGNPDTSNDTWQGNCLCEGSVGVAEIIAPGLNAELNVYPNPTRDLLRVEITSGNGARVAMELRDALGRPILAQDLGQLAGDWSGTFDLSALGSGSYVLVVSIGERTVYTRVTRS